MKIIEHMFGLYIDHDRKTYPKGKIETTLNQKPIEDNEARISCFTGKQIHTSNYSSEYLEEPFMERYCISDDNNLEIPESDMMDPFERLRNRMEQP